MNTDMSKAGRYAVLFAAIGALLFDGVELGLMPVASLSVSKSLLGQAFTPTLGGDWFARFTAALMLGAAIGGIFLGGLGDRIGRTKALGISILFYSLFAGMGGYVTSQNQMLVLRFVVGLGIGGVWPNAVALAAECWPDKSRPMIAGILGAALNAGVLLLSQIARVWPITPESWRWIFQLAAAPAALGIVALTMIPESPLWLRTRAARGGSATTSPTALEDLSTRPAPPPIGGSLQELFRPPLLRLTLIGILIGSIPMVGAWAASKWMIPWADKVGGVAHPAYKAVTQGWWALGAVLGSYFGAQIASVLGRRRSYAVISAAATLLTLLMFLTTAPLERAFLPIVLAQGFAATLFFGWLALYLPELFPTRVRAAGAGIAYNVGRFATAVGVMAAGGLFAALGGSYPKVGALCGLVYLLGLVAIWFAPDTSEKALG